MYLSQARSKIHLSFDLWMSPNKFALCGVTAHFVSRKWSNESVLVALKRMTHTHTAADVAPILSEVIEVYGLDPDQLGVFVADNFRVTTIQLKLFSMDLDMRISLRNGAEGALVTLENCSAA